LLESGDTRLATTLKRKVGKNVGLNALLHPILLCM